MDYYIIAAFVVVFILLLIMLYCHVPNIYKKDKGTHIYIDTQDGTISITVGELANKLQKVRDGLISRKPGVIPDEEKFNTLIDKSIENLVKFIEHKPQYASDVCKNRNKINNRLGGESVNPNNAKADIIDAGMRDSISPYEQDWDPAYKTVLDWGATEKELETNPKFRLEFLIRNLDIVIGLLRSDVCNTGRINMTKLNDILKELNVELSKTGDISIKYGDSYIDKYKKPKERLFIRDSVIIEPFETTPNENRKLYNKKSSVYFDEQKDLILGDLSVEGSVEQDILGYKPPGHIISQLYDKSDHYTVNVNSCLGKTPTDDELWKDCVREEKKLILALDGQPKDMLNCIGDCNSVANSAAFYNKIESNDTVF